MRSLVVPRSYTRTREKPRPTLAHGSRGGDVPITIPWIRAGGRENAGEVRRRGGAE